MDEKESNLLPWETPGDSMPVTVPPPVMVDWRTKVPSVAQLTRRLRGHIENSFFDVWVKGEISNFKKPVSGHAYFSLKDASSQLRAVMFRTSLSKLKFQVKDGTEVLLHGNITVYEARGDYQMIADSMEPVGVGALQLAFEQLKSKLSAEGLFQSVHKKPLPFLPRRIGVITSSTGAAVRDILKVLHRRFPNLHVMVIATAVQGEKAAAEIKRAIGWAARWNQERPEGALDVLIVGRGGGSLEDLWPFNEEIVARAIFECPIPIISAVGHEIDTTIADYVADLRAPTPSAAAEVVVPRKQDLQATVGHHLVRLADLIHKKVEQNRLHLGHLGQRLVDPRKKIKISRESIRRLSDRLVTAIKTILRLEKRRLEYSAQMLHSLSPLQVIGRGYSLTKSEAGQEIIRSVTQCPPGTAISTKVSDGEILSVVF